MIFDQYSQPENKITHALATAFSNVLKLVPSAVPTIEVLQRRYKTQRSIPNVDAKLSFDLLTAFNHKNSSVKKQPSWIVATYNTFNPKRGNTQLVVGMVFNYKDCSELEFKQVVNAVVESWVACKPFVTALVDGEL